MAFALKASGGECNHREQVKLTEPLVRNETVKHDRPGWTPESNLVWGFDSSPCLNGKDRMREVCAKSSACPVWMSRVEARRLRQRCGCEGLRPQGLVEVRAGIGAGMLTIQKWSK